MLTKRLVRFAVLVASSLPGVFSAPAMADGANTSPALVQYGRIHEAIGQHKSHSRVALNKITALPNFYGIGALEGLKAEITIVDSEAIVTGVTSEGTPDVREALDAGATMLVGMSVQHWTDIEVRQEVPPASFDNFIRDAASANGIDVAMQFMFMVDGDFTDLRLHVLNGACPIHARMKKLELADSEKPYELEAPAMKGRLVGLYAEDSVGALTHPDTNTHVHIVYLDPSTGERVTGHVERIGLAKGVTLRLPAHIGSTNREKPE